MKLNWAERWAVNNPLRVVEQRWEIRWLRRFASLPPEAVAVEIGCGRGAGASLILEAFRPAKLHATDLDLEMVRRARAYLPKPTIEKLHLCVADALHLPYGDTSVDAVFGFGVLHHIPDWRGAVADIARVLKPGGLYFLEELYPSLYQNALTRHILLHPTEDRFRSEDLRRALAGAGLRLGKSLEIPAIGILGFCSKSA